MVSEFGLGCARIGGIFKRRPQEFNQLLHAAVDYGINFFDTADIYSQGESEALLGRAFRRMRDRVVIASKAGYILPARRQLVARVKPLVRPVIGWLRLDRSRLPRGVRGAPAQNFSPLHLRRAVEASLRRLGTDRLDLLQLHSPPAATIEAGDWVEALESLAREGKIRHYGISCDTVDAALAALDCAGSTSIQIPLNLLEQRFSSVLPLAREREMAVLARECLANGVLVKPPGTIDLDEYFGSADAASKKVALESYRERARDAGMSLAWLALNYVRQLEGVTVTLIGVSRLEQLEALFSSAQRPLASRPAAATRLP
jgi:aryl-alcohol dehydrogenase-like predicted oxidoreductase